MHLLRSLLVAVCWEAAIQGGLAQPAATLGIFAQAATIAEPTTSGASRTSPTLQRSFADWKAACAKLPSNRALRGGWPQKELSPLARFEDFEEVLNAFFEQCKNASLAATNRWVGPPPTANQFFNTARAYLLNAAPLPFQPFAEKRVLPQGSEIFVHADLHGDIHSLLAELSWLNDQRYLREFGIVHTNFYMVYLGDYTDRGAYGVEVLYTLLRLKLANPEKVFLLRGNHEEASMHTRYGFFEEGQTKYGAKFEERKVVRAYDFLPVVLYLGSGGNFIQCNHGGMEAGFSPAHLLDQPGSVGFEFLGTLNQLQFFKTHPRWFTWADGDSSALAARALDDFRPLDPVSPHLLGFMWNDFSILASEPQFALVSRRGFAYGARATEFLLRSAGSESNRVQAVFRGHQHSSLPNGMMYRLLASRGIFRHWQNGDSRAFPPWERGDSPALLTTRVQQLSELLEQSEEREIPPGSVWTFNVSPDSVYGEGCHYNFDAFGILKMAANFTDWRLKVVNVPINP